MMLRKEVVGRSRELNSWITSVDRGHGLHSFYGLGGTGKTTLLEYFYHYSRLTNLCAFIDLESVGNSIELVELLEDAFATSPLSQEIVDELSELRRKNMLSKSALLPTQSISASNYSLIEQVSQVQTLTGEALFLMQKQVGNELCRNFIKFLLDASSHTRVCILIDGLEKASEEVATSVSTIVRRCQDNAVFAIAGRYEDHLLASPIAPIPDEEIRQYLSREEIADFYHFPIIDLSKGHGLCLNLLVSYVKHAPNSSADALLDFHPLDPFTDPAKIIHEFWERLILEPIEQKVREVTDDLRFSRIAVFLRYSPSIYDLSPNTVFAVFKSVPELSQHFPSSAVVQSLFTDPIVEVHLHRYGKHIRYHDLIRDVGDSGLLGRFPRTYKGLHRAASVTAIQNLQSSGNEKVSPHVVDATLQPEHSFKFHTLDWQKNPRKHEELAMLWPRLTTERAHGHEFDEWRSDLCTLVYHLLRFSPLAGVKLLDGLIEQAFSPTKTPLCLELVRTTLNAPDLDSFTSYWLRYLHAIFGLIDTVKTLEYLLLDLEVPLRIKLKAALALARTYSSTDKAIAERYLAQIESWSDRIEPEEQATFWRELAYSFSTADDRITPLQKAVLYSYSPWDKADSLQKLGIAYRHCGQLELSGQALSESLRIWYEIEEGDKIGETLIALGDLYASQQDIQRARAMYQDASDVLSRSADEYSTTARQKGHFNSLIGMSIAAQAKCDISENNVHGAIEKLEKAIAIHRRDNASSQHSLGWELRLLGQLQEYERRYDQAMLSYTEAIDVTPSAKHRLQALYAYSQLLDKQGKAKELSKIIGQMDALVKNVGPATADKWIEEVRSFQLPA